MNVLLFRRMYFRKKFCIRFLAVVVISGILLYICLLLFGDLKTPLLMHLTDLNKCPVCYGVSICPELYSNQILLETTNQWSHMLNAKNIYYGYTKSNRRVVLKKLAHDWELRAFDAKLCSTWNLNANCKPVDLLNVSNLEDEILKVVKLNLTSYNTEPRNGLILCPYAYSIYDLVQPFLSRKKSNIKSDLVNIWTMLKVNPEPIILQLIPKSHGWPVPAWGGVCGRLELVAYSGIPLMQLKNVSWIKRLKYAQGILNAAMDFTFKHDRFRFYFMDWSLDNIVVNEKDEITFVDFEDVIILDKHVSPDKDLPDWYKRYSRENMGPGFSFSIHSMCKHHLSDHNLWAACYILAGDNNPLLYPIPAEVNLSRPHFSKLVYDCLNNEDRFNTVTKLQQVISEMLSSEQKNRKDLMSIRYNEQNKD